MTKEKKTVLIILDGWGHGEKNESNAIYNAQTPFIDSLYNKYPNSELKTYGKYVGLPNGQMGNSEVGHLNIGAGRVVEQDLVKINMSCKNNSLKKNRALKSTIEYVKTNNKALHLIGLVSDGGIHSHQDHLIKLCKICNEEKINNVYIHAFTDGRDTNPEDGKKFIQNLEENLHGAKIASVCGRYYSMDRDNRWDRIKVAYDLLTKGIGEKSKDISKSIQTSYNNGISDEFIKPIVAVNNKNNPIAKISEGDAVICFNFRTDRCREITKALTQIDLDDYQMKKLNLHYTTMTKYDEKFKNINVIFEKENLKNTLGEIISKSGLTQNRIAETEKYPHVTFFFSGGREKTFSGEKRNLINSPLEETYDLKPEMSAYEVTNSVINVINKDKTDFICVNYANTDMVGHTGNYNAIIKAVQTIDRCAKNVVENAIKKDYAILIISDHGNADYTINTDGSINTSHTMNLVPCFLVNTDFKEIMDGDLSDIAPTILNIMGLDVPKEMTGKILTK